ncbi:hypothetical protein [Inquilinus sp.]|jgi:hypothetical protein|uniref:hypothetical protein n=1 Tax=Inquilinus sp. TaxID=1932117 RepID=UPI003784A477
MRRILSLACGLGVMLGAAGPAWAQATVAEAARLKAVFAAWLPPMEELAPAEADYLLTKLTSYQVIGLWQVDPDGDGYRIRSPGVRTSVAETLGPLIGQFVLACDPELWRATPAADGTYALNGDTPPTCRLKGEGGSAWLVSAGHRRTSGSIDPGGGLSLDTVLEQVTAENPAIGRLLTIDRMDVSNILKPGANGRSDLVQRLSLHGVSFAVPDGGGTITADLLAMDAATEGTESAAAAKASVALARRLSGLTRYPRPRPHAFLGDVPDMLGVRPSRTGCSTPWAPAAASREGSKGCGRRFPAGRSGSAA